MRKYGIALALFIIGACTTGDGTEPLVTTSVQVTATPNTISVNETAQASASAKDQNGNALSNRTVSWTSLNPSIATVNPTTGQIKGVAPGNATIQATIDGVTGSATVTVLGVQASCASGVVNIDIPSGAISVVNSRATGGCIKVVSTTAASSYILIGANTNPLPDVLAQFALRSDEGETIPAATLLVNPYKLSAQLSQAAQDNLPGIAQMRFETKLRKLERATLDFRAGSRAYLSRRAKSDVRFSQSAAAVPGVGDKTSFKVPVTSSGDGGSCTSFTTVSATVKYVSNRAIIYLDDAAPAGGFTDADYQGIATEFDNLIYPTDVANFGTPLDEDNNSRVIILYTPQVNKLTDPGASSFVGGFFFLGDFFPNTGQTSNDHCTQSNRAEIFYVLAPDPNGTINSNRRTTSDVRQGTRGTIAHEFQHMINASVRFNNTSAEFESTWLDEALSHTAEDLNGRAARGLGENSNLTFSQLVPNADALNDFNAFFYQNFIRFSSYLKNPGYFSATSAMADTSLAVRGAAWALVRYTMDHYAPGGDTKAFLKALDAGPDTGVVNLVNRAGGVPFDSLAAGWMVANYADDAGIPNLSSKYTYFTYDMRDNVRKVLSNNPANQVYPLAITPISGSGVAIAGIQARSGSGSYFSFSRGAGGQARTFRMMSNDLTGAANFTGASLILLRTQ
jgi:hypothetical protein